MAALDGGDGFPMKADLLIDSVIHKTLLMKEQWERPQLRGANRIPKLKESAVRLIPYGTDRSLELLGKATCPIKAAVGADIIAIVYEAKGA